MQFKWFTQNTQSLRNFRGVDHSEIFEHLLPFGKYAFFINSTQILRKIRKIYAKNAKFTQNTQNTQKKPSLKYTNFTQNLRKLRNVTQKNFA